MRKCIFEIETWLGRSTNNLSMNYALWVEDKLIFWFIQCKRYSNETFRHRLGTRSSSKNHQDQSRLILDGWNKLNFSFEIGILFPNFCTTLKSWLRRGRESEGVGFHRRVLQNSVLTHTLQHLQYSELNEAKLFTTLTMLPFDFQSLFTVE